MRRHRDTLEWICYAWKRTFLLILTLGAVLVFVHSTFWLCLSSTCCSLRPEESVFCRLRWALFDLMTPWALLGDWWGWCRTSKVSKESMSRMASAKPAKAATNLSFNFMSFSHFLSLTTSFSATEPGFEPDFAYEWCLILSHTCRSCWLKKGQKIDQTLNYRLLR